MFIVVVVPPQKLSMCTVVIEIAYLVVVKSCPGAWPILAANPLLPIMASAGNIPLAVHRRTRQKLLNGH